MPLNAKLLATKMFEAARAVLTDDEADVRDVLQMQVRTLAHVACDIEQLRRRGAIDAERAALLFEMQRTASRAALTTVEKIGVRAAERLLTAAISAIGKAVLGTLGFSPAGVRLQFKAGKDL